MMVGRWIVLCGLGALAREGVALELTGNVAVDFDRPESVFVTDPQDVGLPSTAPPGTISGWDLEAVAFHLDLIEDRLYVGLDFLGICGDADGDGDPGGTSPWLAAMSGADLPGLQGMEAVCVLLDFDRDGQWDLIAGNRMLEDPLQNAFYISDIAGPVFSIPLAFDLADGPVPDSHFHQPGPESPDYELVLKNAGSLLELVGNSTCFDFTVFTGSYSDAGIGEDALTGSVCLSDGGRPPAPQVHIALIPGGSLALVWNPVAAADSYRILDAPNPYGPWSPVTETTANFWLRPPAGSTEAKRFYQVVSLRQN